MAFDLPKVPTKAQRAKALRYYRLIYGYRTRDGEQIPGLYNPSTDVPVRSKSAKRLRAIQDSEGQAPHKGIKVAFVESVADPSNPGKLLKPRIKLSGGQVTKTYFDVTQVFYRFRNKLKQIDIDDGDNADDIIDVWAEMEVSRILKLAPHVKIWVVKCGKRQTANPRSRTGILEYVKYLCLKYGNAGEWLLGLVAFEFHRTASLNAFLESRNLTRKGKARGKKSKSRRGH